MFQPCDEAKSMPPFSSIKDSVAAAKIVPVGHVQEPQRSNHSDFVPGCYSESDAAAQARPPPTASVKLALNIPLSRNVIGVPHTSLDGADCKVNLTTHDQDQDEHSSSNSSSSSNRKNDSNSNSNQQDAPPAAFLPLKRLPPQETMPTAATSTEELETGAVKPSLGLPFPSRQEGKQQQQQSQALSVGLGLPVANRQEAKALRAEPPVTYVTETVTTPVARSARWARPRAVPVPLTQCCGVAPDVCLERATSSSAVPQDAPGIPKWARASSNSGSGNSMSPPSGQQLPSELASTLSSLNSAMTASIMQQHQQHQHQHQQHLAAGQPPPPLLVRYDSNASFSWAPQNLCVQSRHRKLSETYQDYKMHHMVGEGRHGAVFIVQHKTSGKYYACKLLHKGDHDSSTLNKEIEMMRKLDHPNIVRLYEVNEDREGVFLLMELCHGGDLFERIADAGHLTESAAKVFAHQMLDALAYCHSMGVVHHDVKPENFLLETEDPDCSVLKLADFGIATRVRFAKSRSTNFSNFNSMNQSGFHSGFQADGSGVLNGSILLDGDGGHVSGSLPYMAPELLVRRWDSIVKDCDYDRQRMGAGDVWSCGVVIYVMLSGDLPYGDSIDAICDGGPPDFSSKVWQHVSDEAKDLIMRLLNRDLKERWTAHRALRHPWFEGRPPATARPLPLPTPLSDVESNGEETARPRFVDDVLFLTDPALALQENRPELARRTLRLLRMWRRQPKLRRVALATIAKRLEAEHPAMFFARLVYSTFGHPGEKLRCAEFVAALNAALCVDEVQEEHESKTPPPPLAQGHPSDDRSSGAESEGTAGSYANAPLLSPHKDGTGNSITGWNMRQRMKGVIRRLSRVSEDPYDLNISDCLSASPGLHSISSEELVSLTELMGLVDSVDGLKTGSVDFTLLVAAFLPPSVYRDELRIQETFEQFDIRCKGCICAEDLAVVMRTSVRSKDASNKHWALMVAEFDSNGDGNLDYNDFRKMLQGTAEQEWADFATTPKTELTPSCTSTSRASPGTATTAALLMHTPAGSLAAATPTPAPSPGFSQHGHSLLGIPALSMLPPTASPQLLPCASPEAQHHRQISKSPPRIGF